MSYIKPRGRRTADYYEFKRCMAVLLASPHVNCQIVAVALGVSVSTVRAWFVAVRLRRTISP